ncbi:hypothetical protein [Kitasatospora sp. NPDC089509]|uniref:hypothetical protein n=1 Tax=Kitasatospora sp. NPDC089509 TaxID=3364079 RepID=UPI003808B65B
MVGWIVLVLVTAPAVLFFVVVIAAALHRPKSEPSYGAPRPAPPSGNRPAASAVPSAPAAPSAPVPRPTGEPDSHREFHAWLAAYRRAHPNATPAMEAAAVRESYEDRTKYRGVSPGMKAAHKAIERQRRGIGWDGRGA